MDIRLLNTDADYIMALNRFEDIFDPQVGTHESDEADILWIIIDEYENKYFPIEAPDPIEAIKVRMQELEFRQVDLVSELGGKNRASDGLIRC